MTNENEQVQLNGTVESITYRREDTGFTVLDLDSGGELVTVVGVIPEISAGEKLRAQGHWDYHASFGRQFRVQLCERELPSSAEDILKYLSSGAVRGIGPVMAARIVEAFGGESFDILENDPQRLAAIKGISLNKALEASREFKKQFAVREVMLSLEKYGMTPNECIQVFKVFGAGAIDTVRRNPYLLCEEGIGVGFARADAISAALPEPPERNLRTQAGILHILRHNLGNGHSCLPRRKLLPLCADFLEIDTDTADIAIDQLIESKRLFAETFSVENSFTKNSFGEEFLFLPYMHRAEKRAAERLRVFLDFPPAGKETLEADIQKIEAQNGIAYEDRQREAMVTAVRKGMLILTGGPGTGKTTTLNGILRLFESDGLDVALAAPTGRAAKRMSVITGREAKTIHRLLEAAFDPDRRSVFGRDAQNPLDADVVILDELSMVDSLLFSALLDALPLGCRFVMVGDSDQLPPVGAGNVLHDLIDSGLMPVVELTKVFRQAMESLIVSNAHQIVRGEMPVLDAKNRDFFFLPKPLPYQAALLIRELCVNRLPAAYGYSPLTDIQVICPSRKGESGTNNLNRVLQAALNPPEPSKKEISSAGRLFREGDKVMQTRNNYDIQWTGEDREGSGIFNGDIGILTRVRPEGSLEIRFDDKLAQYPAENIIELEHAYAITVHKSQGNEFEAVLLPAAGIVPQLAYRNLLYTAVTRAKSLLIVVGDERQLRLMVENDRQSKRYSALKAFLLTGEKA